jgi:ATP-binding cassette, subfamily C, bacterial CydD
VLRGFLVARSLSAVIGTAAVITQALALASILAILAGPGVGGVARSAWLPVLAAVIVTRIALAWWDRRRLEATAARWKDRLRVDAAAGLAARTLPRRDADTGAVITLLTKGVDAIDRYLAGTVGVLPAALVAPAGVVAAVLLLNWPSGLVLLVTLLSVPVLLALVGGYTKDRTDRQWTSLLRLGNQFFEAVSGLLTLRVLGRAGRTAQRVEDIAEEHRKATVAALRVAFLSSFVLESLTSLAVALVAVPVGFFLLDGAISLRTGLAVLLLTPEVYRPLRQLGASFHAGQEARTALDQLAPLSTPQPRRPTTTSPRRPADGPIALHRVTVGFDDPVLTDVSLVLRPGTHYAVVGPSGAGKSTLLRTIAGLLPPLHGRITAGDIDITTADRTNRIALLPQRPHVFTGTVADNIRIGAPSATDDALWSALESAGAADFVRALPRRLDTPVGERGARLSSGERQRIALARALVREVALLLLDEPTARLDSATERRVLDALAGLPGHTTVVMVTHRRPVADGADVIIEVAAGRAEPMAALR